jgi:enoyl reductase-like protein
MDKEIITSEVLSKEIMDKIDEIGKGYQELIEDEAWNVEANYKLDDCIENLATIVNKPFYNEIERMEIEEELHLYILHVQSVVDATSTGLDDTQQTICDVMSTVCGNLWKQTIPTYFRV